MNTRMFFGRRVGLEDEREKQLAVMPGQDQNSDIDLEEDDVTDPTYNLSALLSDTDDEEDEDILSTSKKGKGMDYSLLTEVRGPLNGCVFKM